MFALLPGGKQVGGLLGSHCWGRGCGDGPAPPAEELPRVRLTAGIAEMNVAIEGDVGFVYWSASYSESGSDDAVTLGQGGTELDPDSVPGTPPPVFFDATVASPPSGDWVVSFSVQYHGGGDGIYYWHVVVR